MQRKAKEEAIVHALTIHHKEKIKNKMKEREDLYI
jgi:hypothetical protein